MEQIYKNSYVYTVDGNPSLSQYAMEPNCPVLMPTLKKKKTDFVKACVIVIVILALIILALLVYGIVYLIPPKPTEGIEQQVDGPEAHHDMLTGHKHAIKPDEKSRVAAHLTGKAFTANTLLWDNTHGKAFTNGLHYKDGGLIINETGLFFIYSKIFFRSLTCVKDLDLEQILFIRTNRYPKDIVLMETKKNKHCVVKDVMWYRNSYQAGIFKLYNGDHIYVNVTNARLVNFDETRTFFGLYKL